MQADLRAALCPHTKDLLLCLNRGSALHSVFGCSKPPKRALITWHSGDNPSTNCCLEWSVDIKLGKCYNITGDQWAELLHRTIPSASALGPVPAPGTPARPQDLEDPAHLYLPITEVEAQFSPVPTFVVFPPTPDHRPNAPIQSSTAPARQVSVSGQSQNHTSPQQAAFHQAFNYDLQQTSHESAQTTQTPNLEDAPAATHFPIFSEEASCDSARAGTRDTQLVSMEEALMVFLNSES